MSNFLSTLPLGLWLTLAGTAFAGLVWLYLSAALAAYRLGRLRAHQDLEKRYGDKWFLFPEHKEPVGPPTLIICGGPCLPRAPGGQKYHPN